MKISFDPETDTLRIIFRDVPMEESEERKPGVIIDYDRDGKIVGVEVLDASRRVEDPQSIQHVNVG
jgi:uncharacterized protein YuzE